VNSAASSTTAGAGKKPFPPTTANYGLRHPSVFAASLTIAGRQFESSLSISTASVAVVNPSSLFFFPFVLFLVIALSPFQASRVPIRFRHFHQLLAIVQAIV
jgi:hypothetical protein